METIKGVIWQTVLTHINAAKLINSIVSGSALFAIKKKQSSRTKVHLDLEILYCDPLICWTNVSSQAHYLFGLMLKVAVNSYGHVRTVTSPKHTIFMGKLNLAVNQYFVPILLLVTDNNPSRISERRMAVEIIS